MIKIKDDITGSGTDEGCSTNTGSTRRFKKLISLNLLEELVALLVVRDPLHLPHQPPNVN